MKFFIIERQKQTHRHLFYNWLSFCYRENINKSINKLKELTRQKIWVQSKKTYICSSEYFQLKSIQWLFIFFCQLRFYLILGYSCNFNWNSKREKEKKTNNQQSKNKTINNREKAEDKAKDKKHCNYIYSALRYTHTEVRYKGIAEVTHQLTFHLANPTVVNGWFIFLFPQFNVI